MVHDGRPPIIHARLVFILRIEQFKHRVEVVAIALEPAICRVGKHLKLLANHKLALFELEDELVNFGRLRQECRRYLMFKVSALHCRSHLLLVAALDQLLVRLVGLLFKPLGLDHLFLQFAEEGDEIYRAG